MTPKRAAALLAALAGLSLLLSACGNSGDNGSPDMVDGSPGDGGPAGPSIAWGPGLPASSLSPIVGAQDDFGADIPAAIARAAEAVPMGASQSSRVENGRTVDEMSVRVVRGDDGSLVHEVTDGAQFVVRVPGPLPRQGARLAFFTDLIPGIEPDLSSYPHGGAGGVGVGRRCGRVLEPQPAGPASPVRSHVPGGQSDLRGRRGRAPCRGRRGGEVLGFAADDGSVSLLGAFTACHCASASDGNPDDPVASRR